MTPNPKDDYGLGKMCDVCKAWHEVKPISIKRIRQQTAQEYEKTHIEKQKVIDALDKQYRSYDKFRPSSVAIAKACILDIKKELGL